jgi:uroporphyrinogen-III synthase
MLPRGELATAELPNLLRSRGAFVDEVIVYRTVPGDGVADIVAAIRADAVDVLMLASASAVRFVVDALASSGWPIGRPLSHPIVACVGPVTAEAARAAGFAHVLVARDTTQDDLIARIADWFARSEHAVEA